MSAAPMSRPMSTCSLYSSCTWYRFKGGMSLPQVEFSGHHQRFCQLSIKAVL